MNDEQAAKILGLLVTTTRGEKPDVEGTEVWLELLGSLDGARGWSAAQLVVERQVFFPAWAEFRQAYDDMDPTTADVPTTAEAWNEVCRMVSKVGRDGAVRVDDFSHPAIFGAIQGFGSWVDLCNGEEMINRAHFRDYYPQQVAAHRRREQIRLVELDGQRTPMLEAADD